jgi:peptide/nickel transport system substrate-binding protein
LVVCQKEEPTSLYLYGDERQEARHIHEALYDGPIDHRTYTHQPIILEKLPNLEDGDAMVDTVIVQAGDRIVDAYNEPVELEEGMLIFPTDCRSAECAVEFDGEPVEMDQMIVTFQMKENLLWSDGTPLTADDSVYSFELRRAPATPMGKFTELRTASYESENERTVVWTGLPGYLDPTYYLNFYPPLPRSLWEEELGYDPADLLTAEEATQNPLGWGPFTVSEWVKGDHITLSKNPYYFRANDGLPYVDNVIFRFVEDANTAVAQLLSGECDIVTQDANLETQAELLLKLQEHGVLETAFVPDTLWEHVDFGINPANERQRADFFEDVRVRQAIAHCLNRQEIVNTLLYGRSPVLDSYLPPEHPLYADELIEQYPYDPEKGKALLEEVGWMDEDEDGVREATDIAGIRNGTPLAFRWQSTSQTFHRRYMERFQEDLARCGMDVTIENLPLLEFFAQNEDGPLYGRSFDLSSFAWSASTDIPPCDLYLSTEIPNEDNNWSGSNFSGFANEAYDEACLSALQSLPGTESYIIGHKEAQRIFSEQLPALPLFLRLQIAATRPLVRGFLLDPTENSELWNIEAIDLER